MSDQGHGLILDLAELISAYGYVGFKGPFQSKGLYESMTVKYIFVLRKFDYCCLIVTATVKEKLKSLFDLVLTLSVESISKYEGRVYDLSLHSTDYVNALKGSWKHKSQMSV